MKLITDIDKKIPHTDDDATEAQRAEMPTYRRLLRFVTVGVQPDGVEQSDRLHQARMKLSVVDPDVLFEDAEFEILKKMVDANRLQWGAYLHHEMVQLMRDAEKRKVDVETKKPEVAA